MTIPALKLSGLIWWGIIAGISIESLAIVKTANVTDLTENDRPKGNASKYKYMGDFMKQFSWSEFYMADLDEF